MHCNDCEICDMPLCDTCVWCGVVIRELVIEVFVVVLKVSYDLLFDEYSSFFDIEIRVGSFYDFISCLSNEEIFEYVVDFGYRKSFKNWLLFWDSEEFYNYYWKL